jgi:SAM-dependent methyltransferase
MFLKGYTSAGFAEKVYHIHVRYPGDWDEMYFRDYLILHPEAAAAYATLKRQLQEQFAYDRDGYTDAKGAFIKDVTKRAREALEKMADFFAARVDMYDNYMLQNVEGAAEAYAELAKHIPAGTQTLLDLGCGTGLELAEIFRLHPHIHVTGIDLTQAMLDKLSEKYKDKSVVLICASYLSYDFGTAIYDGVISFETMHHLTHEEKIGLYKNIHRALKPGSKYIECDYMVDTQEEEDYGFDVSRSRRAENAVPEDECYHIDTPCTMDNQIKLFLQAGFVRAEKVWRKGATTIIVADKEGDKAQMGNGDG